MSEEKVETQTREEWILQRYGEITTSYPPVCVVTVPVYSGRAMGVGATREAAIEALFKDLTEVRP